jgi:hypothetical protein
VPVVPSSPLCITNVRNVLSLACAHNLLSCPLLLPPAAAAAAAAAALLLLLLLLCRARLYCILWQEVGLHLYVSTYSATCSSNALVRACSTAQVDVNQL